MTERLKCEDCGLEFDEGQSHREDPLMALPSCEALDVLLAGDVEGRQNGRPPNACPPRTISRHAAPAG